MKTSLSHKIQLELLNSANLLKALLEDFCKDKEMFDFSDYSAESKYYDDSDKLVVCKIKDELPVLI